MTNEAKEVNRQYQSPLREAQARATRRAVVAAAARLFVERGFGSTSVEDIAAAAGVSRATVFSSVGGKAALLRKAYDFALVGDDEPVALPDRHWAQQVRAAPSQAAAIRGYAAGIADYSSRVAPIYEAFRGAASLDLEVRAEWNEIRAERRRGAGNFVRVLRGHGELRPGLADRTAGDIVWLLNDPGLYHQLVNEQRWTQRRFTTWLTETMQAQLIAPEPS